MTELNIRRVFDEFLEAQRARLAPKTLARYEAVLDLLGSYLNGYAHESLSAPEAARFERSYNAEGRDHREFCDLFGPDKIVESLDGFLGYFMVRKVIAGEDLLRAAGTVTKKLSKWLVEQGYFRPEIDAGAAARDDKDCLEFEHFTVTKLDPGRLWLAAWHDGAMRERGPNPAPESATRWLRSGWTISCSLGRIRKSWHLLDVANVYPG